MGNPGLSSRRRWRSLGLVLTTLALLAATAVPVGATHLEDPRNGLEEAGFHDLGGTGFNTDVWAWSPDDGRLFATSGTWGTLTGVDPCPSETDNILAPVKSGVKIVDATDPANPVMAARIGQIPGSQSNDVKVLRMAGGTFAGGDILAHSLEPCEAAIPLSLLLGGPVPNIPLAQTGFQLYDVTEPTGPVRLGTYNNGGFGTHNLFMFNHPDGNSYVAAVFNEQSLITGIRGEVQFVDITDPAGTAGILGSPVSTWELANAAAQGGPAFEDLCKERGTHIAACFLHDVWTSPDGTIAYLSFWDAGLILLDISDITKPTFLGQTQSGTLDEEGNTHAAVPLPGTDLVIVGDEDFVGPGELPHVTVNEAPDPTLEGKSILGSEFTNTRPLAQGSVGPLPAILADDPGNFGCTYSPGLVNTLTGQDWIAVARRGGTCPLFQEKVTAAEAAGADGVIVVNNGPGSISGLAAGTIPAVMIPFDEGEQLIAAIEADPLNFQDVIVTLELLPVEPPDPWGFMRVFEASDPAAMTEVSTFKAPHVDTFPQFPESVFSAHNPIVGPDGRVYFSWYTDGVRVLEVSEGGAVNETAWFVPLPGDHPDDLDSDPHGVQEDNIGFWGSYPVCQPATADLLVFNSDFNRGLYILNALYDHPCEKEQFIPAKVTGGGQAPGSTADGPISFGFNAGSKGKKVQGHIHVLDDGTGDRIVSETITQVTEISDTDGRRVRVRGTCRVNGGDPQPCEVDAVDRGEPGTTDEFRIEVRTSSGETVYAAGGTLLRGNVKVH